MLDNYLIIHKSILPEYYEKVVAARRLLEEGRVREVSQAVKDVGISRSTYYKYKEYRYYDFRLDTLSPARGIGDSIAALPYPIDRNGINRANKRPDAGCYQFEE